MFETGSHELFSQGQTLYQMQSKERVWSSERGCTVPDPRITGENAVLIMSPNYHKTRIRSVALIALLSQFASILENEAEKKLGVTLDELLEIHRDSYLCRLCDMTFLKISQLHQKIAELEYSSLLHLTRR